MIFDKNYFNEDLDYSDSLDTDFSLVDTSDAYEPNTEGAYLLCAEMESAYSEIMKGIAVNELSYYARTGRQIPVTEGTLGDFFTKVINFFKKMWQKIKGIFAKFFSFLDKFFRTNKSFYEKYSKMTLPSTIEMEAFTYTHMDWTPNDMETVIKDKKLNFDTIIGSPKDDQDRATKLAIYDPNNKDTHMDDIRGKILNKNTIDSNEFSAEIYKYFRNNEDTKSIIDVKVSDALNSIKDYNKTKKDATKAYKKFESSINKTIKELERLSKNADEGDAKAYNYVADIYKSTLSCMTLTNGGYLKALKEKLSQSKTAVVKAAAKQTDENYDRYKERHEGATYGGSFLSNVSLI